MAVAGALGGLTFGRGAAFAQSAKRLNVLFIAVDDLRPELGCYGRKEILSPNLDQLAAGGLLFERAYCQQAVCSPSRTSLMTGLRPDSTKVYDLETHFRDTVPDVVTLPQHFMKHGYYAAGIGKIYHGSLNDKQSWSEPWLKAQGSGYCLKANQELMAKKRAAAKKKGLTGKNLTYAARGPATESADVSDNAYPDGDTAERAIEIMRRLAKREEPFFLATGFLKPHLPFNCPKKYWDKYRREDIKLADNPFAPKDAPPMALSSWGELRNYEDIPQKGAVSDDKARELIHGYYACVSSTDAQIGKLLDELERLGLADNTVVILWGDHGWHLGDHGLWCKHTNFENATRAPMIVRAPGFEGGQRTRALSEFVDIYPSLCELAGLPLPTHLEGTSFVPLMKDPKRPWKKAAISQYPRGQAMGYSLRTDRFHFIEWLSKKDKTRLAVELYDHEQDPAENVNIALKPEHKKLVMELSAQLKGGWKAARPG